MSGEPQTKRAKLTDKKGKWNHFKKTHGKSRIEIGDKGIQLEVELFLNEFLKIVEISRIPCHL